MNNKVLVKLFIPELDSTFDIFIPVNEVIWKVKKIIIKSISDLTGGLLDIEKEYILMNKTTSVSYGNNYIVINTDIRNATELILLSQKNNNQNMISAKIGMPKSLDENSDFIKQVEK